MSVYMAVWIYTTHMQVPEKDQKGDQILLVWGCKWL